MPQEMTIEEIDAALKASGDMIFLEDFGWWIRDKPYPPTNYYPPGCLTQLPVKSDTLQ